MPDDSLGVVLRYVREGLPVHPVHTILSSGLCSCTLHTKRTACVQGTPGKHPRTQHGFKDATTNENVIARWNRQFRKTNWAVILGLKSSLCCLDVDPRRGGMESLKILFGENLENLPATRIILTGSNGMHIYFLYDPAFAQKVKDFLPGIEFLSDGNYIIMPGSVHESGNTYTFYQDLPICELPEIVKAAIRKFREVPSEQAKQSQAKTDLYMLEGHRDVTLTRFVGKMFRMGEPPSSVMEHAKAHNEAFGDPPIPYGQVRKIVRSIGKREEEARVQRETEKQQKINPIHLDAEKAPKVFTVMPFELMMDKYAGRDLEWLIEGWLPKRTTGFIQSKPQSFKTWLSLMMAYSISTGEPLFGRHKVLECGPVLYVQQEDDHTSIAGRLQHIFNLPDFQYVPGGIEFPRMPRPEIYFHDQHSFKLSDSAMMADVERLIPEKKLKAIFIDPFYTITENRDNYAQAAFQMGLFKRWRDEYGVTVMLLHHSGKGDGYGKMRENLLGSQLLNAWNETTFALAATDISNEIIIERHTKSAPPMDLLKLRFDITPGHISVDEEIYLPDGAAASDGQASMERIEKVRRYISQTKTGNTQQLSRDLEIPETAIRKCLSELKAKKVGGYYQLPKGVEF